MKLPLIFLVVFLSLYAPESNAEPNPFAIAEPEASPNANPLADPEAKPNPQMGGLFGGSQQQAAKNIIRTRCLCRRRRSTKRAKSCPANNQSCCPTCPCTCPPNNGGGGGGGGGAGGTTGGGGGGGAGATTGGGGGGGAGATTGGGSGSGPASVMTLPATVATVPTTATPTAANNVTATPTPTPSNGTGTVGSSGTIIRPDVDYCAQCTNNVACGVTEGIKSTCPSGAALVPLTDDVKNQIVNLHNTFRNTIASGGLSGYNQASKMGRVQWNDELAFMAVINAETCIYQHDACIATTNFMLDGQNIAFVTTTNSTPDVTEAINVMVKNWTDEFMLTNQNVINSLVGPASGQPDYLHFTLIVNEEATLIGCGIIQFLLVGGITRFNMICNYSRGNVNNLPVYELGTPCSNCTSGCDTTFPALCTVNEPYAINVINTNT